MTTYDSDKYIQQGNSLPISAATHYKVGPSGEWVEVIYNGRDSDVLSFTPERFVTKFLRNGSSIAMNADGSMTPVNFDYTVGSGGLRLFRFLFQVVDTGVLPNLFGGIAALSTGCLFKVLDTDGTTVLFDFLDGEVLKQNYQFGWIAGSDVPILDANAANEDSLLIRYTINNSGGTMYLTEGQIIRFTVRDNLTGITAFNCVLQGTTAS